MLKTLGLRSIEDLFKDIPDEVFLKRPLRIPDGISELEVERSIKEKLQNDISPDRYTSFLGGGIYDHFIPAIVDEVARRGEFYTSYTPYQAEASQGILQVFFEYQSLITELFAMDVSNASVYDGPTALVEAVMMAKSINNKKKVLISKLVNPEYRKVLKTYLKFTDTEIIEVGYAEGLTDIEDIKSKITDETACLVAQSPNFLGSVEDMRNLSDIAHNNNALFIACVDPISLGLLSSPGSYNADIAVAEGQSLGNTPYFGGACLGIFTCRRDFVRKMPGRVVGMTEDKGGNPAFCLTLQTREQHIRRARATSNICSNQALYALRASVYLGSMGRNGLKEVANLCLQKSHYLADRIVRLKGVSLIRAPFFKEFLIKCPIPPQEVNKRLMDKGFLAGVSIVRDYPDLENGLLICVTEKKNALDLDRFADSIEECIYGRKTSI